MRRGLVLLLLVAPLALVACGGGSPKAVVTGDPVAYVKHAAAKTAGLSSEHETMTGTFSVLGHTISMSGNGDFDNAKTLGSFTATVAAGGSSQSIDEVIAGASLYMTSPLFSRSLPQGKKWFKLDLGAFAKAKGINYSTLMSQSPAQSLRRLEAAGTVTQVGAETIDGVATTHFRVDHLDITKLPQGAKIEALGHPTYGPIDVWVGNDNGYVYRESMSFSYSVDGQSASMTMRVDLSKFGESVNATVPPPSQTYDATNNALAHSGTTTVPAP